MLHITTTDSEALSISTTTDFEALSISNSNSFVEDHVLQKSHLNKNSHFESDNIDSQFENDNNDSQFESTNSNNMSISYSNVSVNASRNWKTYREAKEKTKNLESIIQLLSSPVKHTVKRNLANSILTEVLVNTDSENIHEATVVSSMITYLKELNEKYKYPTMHQTMHDVFKDKMNDIEFLKWLASWLNIRLSRFWIYVANWKDRNFVETRGKSELMLEVRQNFYETWVENSFMSTDCSYG